MAHNVKIRYYARENVKMKPHSFYAQPIPNGTYGFEELCKEASHKTGLEPHDVRAAVEMYMDAVMSKLLDGFRVEVGSNFITLGPGLTAKVKDELNDDGTVKKACTADDLTAVGAKSRVTASVHPDFTYHFSQSVKWQKTDKQGNPVENDEDDATLDADDELNPSNQGGSSTGQSNSQSQATSFALTISKSGSGTSTVKNDSEETINNGDSLESGANVYITVTPAEGQIPSATLNGTNVSLTENDGEYVGTFQMPAQASTLVINSGSDAEEGDQN